MCWSLALHGYVNFIYSYPYSADMTQSVQRLVKRWRVRSSKAGGGKRFSVLHARSDWPWGQPLVKCGMLALFPGLKLLRYGVNLTPKSSAVFKNECIYINLRPICASNGMLWGDIYPYIMKGIINNPNSFTSSNLTENPKSLQDRMCRISKPAGFKQAPRDSRSTVKNVQCELFLL